MTLFDMFNKAAGLTEDAKKYNTGDISEKTGLQKQPDGSWKPPKAKGSQPKGTEKKAKDMTYKEAAPKLNEKQKKLLNNMAKQNGKSIEEVFETFKDIIGFGKEQDPKLAEELDRNTRFEQEKLAKKRQKEEEELRQQRQEGEAAARAFKEKVEKGEIVYNEKTGQFEAAPAKAKKPENTSSSSDDIAINPHEEVKEHLNASKYYKQKAKGFTKTDPSYKKYLAKAEEYENKAKAAADDYGLDFSEFIDDSAPLTADTKIKLSQIKTTDDAGFQDGHVSHRKNGDFVKQGGKWVPVKKNGQGNKKQNSSEPKMYKRNPIPIDMFEWAMTDLKEDSPEQEYAMYIWEELENNANTDVSQLFHDVDIQAETFNEKNKKAWDTFKEKFQQEFGHFEKQKPTAKKQATAKQTQKTTTTKKEKTEKKPINYGKAKGLEKGIIQDLKNLPDFEYRWVFVDALKEGKSWKDAMGETEAYGRRLAQFGKDPGEKKWQAYWNFRKEVTNVAKKARDWDFDEDVSWQTLKSL